MTDSLTDIIQDFLLDPHCSDGGYATVETSDMVQLNDIICALVAQKWEADSDGDYPVDYILVDRTRYEPNHFIASPYLHKANTDADRMFYIRGCMLNVQIANGRLDTAIKVWMYEQKEPQ